ncbi:hypothetical protein MJM25_29040, partial [Salmonella enterica subsp. enterica serovar Lubbock]|nr:hypothetical protein [Salmonella enterica subsp. enterica serovar Lubbock]
TWLRDRGYATLTMYQLEDYIHNRANFPARAVVITFDDGLKSVRAGPVWWCISGAQAAYLMTAPSGAMLPFSTAIDPFLVAFSGL